MKNFAIPLPPLPEQRQIAAILTRCDETIAAARFNVGAAKALKMKMINEMLSMKGQIL
jgi:type I restriction enzyme S subunit